MNSKNILIISDDCRQFSGVGVQSAEIIKGLSRAGHNVYQIGVSTLHTQVGKNTHKFNTGELVTIYSSNKYDNVAGILYLIDELKIDAIVLFQDPRFFTGIWLNARAIRNKCPILFYTIWDTDLLPKPDGRQHYNTPIYESCDTLLCISKQTENFCKQAIKWLPENKRPKVELCQHGQDENIFRPLSEQERGLYKKTITGRDDLEFIVLFNSRNQARKKPSDLIYSFNLFNQTLTPELAKKTALILHTDAVTDFGTNLFEVIQALAPTYKNIFIDSEAKTPEQMNILYNASDLVVQCSNAEGFGISINEAMLAGRPIAATVTGGLQDQIVFFDGNGDQIKFDSEFTSNAIGRFKKHGTWAYPMFPSVRRIVGSPQTPYLFDDEVTHETIKEALLYWYNVTPEERNRRGLKGREWCINNHLNSKSLARKFEQVLIETISSYNQTPLFELFPI